MKRNKPKPQQLSFNFDNGTGNQSKSFQINQRETSHHPQNINCKIISLNSFNQRKDNELLNRFYSLSNHLD